MLDQTPDRMWYMIGAILLGAAIIGTMLFFMPEAFASVGGMFDDFIGKVVIGGSEEVVDDDSLQEYLARTYDKGDNDLSMSIRYVTEEDLNFGVVNYDTFIDMIIDGLLPKDMMLEGLEDESVTRDQIVGALRDEFQLDISAEQEGQAMAMSDDDQFVDFVLQLIRESDMLSVFALSEALLVPGDSAIVLAEYHEGFSYYSPHDKKWDDSGSKFGMDSLYSFTDGQKVVDEYDRMVNDGLIEDTMGSYREVLMQNSAFFDRYKGMSEASLSQIFTVSSEYGHVYDYDLGYDVMYVQRDSLYEVDFLHKVYESTIKDSSYISPRKDGSIVINGLTYDRYIGDLPFAYRLV